MAQEIFSVDLPFFYDFMLTDEVPKDPKQRDNLLKLIDRKIDAAREFSHYLDSLEKKNAQVHPITATPQYHEIQKQLSKGIVDGSIFIKLNQDYNHTTFEIDDTKANKQRMEMEINAATRTADESKQKFHEAVAELGRKASSLDVTNLPKIQITDEAVLPHFNKVCYWILDIFYDTPASKFEWENFKKQVFIADKGDDFKRRIQGLYVPKLYDYQIETCQYISSTRPMFQKQGLTDPNWDLILSTADEVIKAFNARQEYTRCKKVISVNKTKIIEAGLDIQQSEKVSSSTRPHIANIYEKLITKESTIRNINLSDYCQDNQNEYAFYKGSQQKIGTFLRGVALDKYGEVEEDDKKKPAGKKGDTKPQKGASPPHATAKTPTHHETAHNSPTTKPAPQPADARAEIRPADVKLEFDEDVQMPDVD